MKIKFLNACTSTNFVLKDLIKKNEISYPTAIVAQTQSHGRGQMGTKWQDEPGKSLLMSLAFFPDRLKAEHGFFISMAAALAVHNVLLDAGCPAKIKWPNDLFAANKKIGGILIENALIGNLISSSVIGIGLNINQSSFTNDLSATSLFNIINAKSDLKILVMALVAQWKTYEALLQNHKFEKIKSSYLKHLLHYQTPAHYRFPNGPSFKGTILDVHDDGRIQLEIDQMGIKYFDIKEIQLDSSRS
jgi:BirA family biotin operon repressor/biotin-[acetyl-CoA-carboxylase] ligase